MCIHFNEVLNLFTGVESIKTCDIAKLLLIKYNILYSLKYLRNIAKKGAWR
ncbi:TPA: hypothetical protein JAJ09_002912 [Clostridioides difficile]|nr:hypothetical protein HMPREF1123_00688 [Clostridioides difficile 050-P50-2011]EQG17862.1 hypothetical protein QIG_2766 [Clostridioides difficile DA00065]HAT6204098.1 hypothetical protein [Clostridioides difficile]HAT6211848.1 hypothetical protein [Clostridioides difficile]HAT6261875.1 hypothetical protein [Clostridioides difficile]